MVGQRALSGIVSVPLLNEHTRTSGLNARIRTWKMYCKFLHFSIHEYAGRTCIQER